MSCEVCREHFSKIVSAHDLLTITLSIFEQIDKFAEKRKPKNQRFKGF